MVDVRHRRSPEESEEKKKKEEKSSGMGNEWKNQGDIR